MPVAQDGEAARLLRCILDPCEGSRAGSAQLGVRDLQRRFAVGLLYLRRIEEHVNDAEVGAVVPDRRRRSEEDKSELQQLKLNTDADFCMKKNKTKIYSND